MSYLELKKRKSEHKDGAAQAQGTKIPLTLDYLFQLVLALHNRMNRAEQTLSNLQERMNYYGPTAKISDWRSLALLKALEMKGVLDPTEVVKLAEELEVADFDLNSEDEDRVKGLEACEGPAENGHFAIFTLSVFKDGKELPYQQVLRSKVQIGKTELFPELDTALIGMSVNQTKVFPLNLMQQTDQASITLLGLRKYKPSEGTQPGISNE